MRLTRRRSLGALLAAPLIHVPAVAADPHTAREAKARALYRHHRATKWGWGEPSNSLASRSADDAHRAVMLYADEACAMPAPTTLPGLASLALSIALANEQFTTADSGDCTELHLRALAEAVLAVTGTAMPPGWQGFVYVPGEAGPCA